MTISLWIDAVILIALVAAVSYGVLLSRRIARLQNALVEMAPVLQAFCDAVTQSEHSVGELRREADRLQESQQRPPAAPAPKRHDRTDLVRQFFEAARTRTS